MFQLWQKATTYIVLFHAVMERAPDLGFENVSPYSNFAGQQCYFRQSFLRP